MTEFYSHVAVKNDKIIRRSNRLVIDLDDNLSCVFPRLKHFLTLKEKQELKSCKSWKDAKELFDAELKEILIERSCKDSV